MNNKDLTKTIRQILFSNDRIDASVGCFGRTVQFSVLVPNFGMLFLVFGKELLELGYFLVLPIHLFLPFVVKMAFPCRGNDGDDGEYRYYNPHLKCCQWYMIHRIVSFLVAKIHTHCFKSRYMLTFFVPNRYFSTKKPVSLKPNQKNSYLCPYEKRETTGRSGSSIC